MKEIHSLHRQKGAEVVEFAVTAVLFFILLFGIIEFSVAMYDKAVLTNASREGARTGILFRPDPRDNVAEDAAIEQAVTDYADGFLISLGGEPTDGITVTITRPDGGTLQAGDELIVTVDYDYQFLLLPGFVTSLGNIIALTATASMRAE